MATQAQAGRSCLHLAKGNPNKVRRRLPATLACDALQCSADAECQLWLCLTCGFTGCGRAAPEAHAMRHAIEPDAPGHCASFTPSDADLASAPHPLVMRASDGSLWCYVCDTDPPLPTPDARPAKLSSRAASRYVALAAAAAAAAPSPPPPPQHLPALASSGLAPPRSGAAAVAAALPDEAALIAALPASVAGLRNLGNTCFFNSVLQALSVTPELRYILAASHYTPPGKLAKLLASLFAAWPGVSRRAHSPRSLFAALARQVPRFRGYRQQDAHELLRVLLGGIQAEEAAASRRPVLTASAVFAGELVSTIVCSVCGTPSRTPEPFLDLSLSLTAPLAPKPVRLRQRSRPSAPTKPSAAAAKPAWLYSGPSRSSTASPARSQRSRFRGSCLRDRYPDLNSPAFAAAVAAAAAANEPPPLREQPVLSTRPASLQLDHTLQAFAQIETLDGDNSYGCEACTKMYIESCGVGGSRVVPDPLTSPLIKRPAAKQYLIRSLPPVLTLHLKRFQQTSYGLRKLSTRLSFPLDLDLEPYVESPPASTTSDMSASSSCAASSSSSTSSSSASSYETSSSFTSPAPPHILPAKPFDSFVSSDAYEYYSSYSDQGETASAFLYTLFAVTVHSGGLGGGHYIAYVKLALPRGGHQWYHCSDSSVRPVDVRAVLSAEAYMLFYRRAD
ncbi:ubiquitin carboxyl-terminal hydrolase [Thecamonas trahens ATCC 50062]|uniref:Ubiquitin carboxyl-terminal hydrolase n=1 Tax=Thecamonas trahens ATCC 50062 TaxID=461836 RepID=A0A0L0DKK1_THETB|nr:ubiquitin carboxyl-terminal hydrolase [Thecamonas trahens ATCC 50062]KNC52832.1 ubiquitin carboxyl-terminal hydrolase [Thecamonas trahens ATCC 50062]|eukprot:XP_013754937.1 ubiquitin carboxyl-terminal hydrolase [Thecamonas trahens ATCC 50062]